MLKNENIEVKPPTRCPNCKEEWLDGRDPFGPPYLITIFDDEIPAASVVLKGWVCGKMAFGTVIRRGPVEGESEPVDMISEDHVYVLDLPSRTWTT